MWLLNNSDLSGPVLILSMPFQSCLAVDLSLMSGWTRWELRWTSWTIEKTRGGIICIMHQSAGMWLVYYLSTTT